MNRNEIARLRNSALPTVARALGYKNDRRDRKRWRRPGSIISINGPKFFDHVNGKGGGGAIDLVIHADQISFQDACRFLAGLPAAPPQPVPVPDTGNLRIPQHDPKTWPCVRDWLAGKRKIDTEWLMRARTDDLLRASDAGEAVFVCRNSKGQETGAEIVATHNAAKRMATGSAKARGGFWMATSNNPPDILFLVESAIDALSVLSIPALPHSHQTSLAVISTAGIARAIPPWTANWPASLILCGHDADRAGDEATGRLMRKDKRVLPCRPVCDGQDWNDILCNIRDGKPGQVPAWHHHNIPDLPDPQIK